jgi:hypothetical protein
VNISPNSGRLELETNVGTLYLQTYGFAADINARIPEGPNRVISHASVDLESAISLRPSWLVTSDTVTHNDRNNDPRSLIEISS